MTSRWYAVDRLLPYVCAAALLAALANVLAAVAEAGHRHAVARQRAHPASAALVRAVANSDAYLHRVAVVAGALTFAALLLWLVWFQRMARNASLFRPVRYPGWAAPEWLLPVLGWVRPKQLVNDIWAAGDPDEDRIRRPRGLPPIYQAWWAAVIGAVVLSRWQVVGPATRAVMLALAIPVAVRLTRRLSARYSARSAPPSTGTTQPVT